MSKYDMKYSLTQFYSYNNHIGRLKALQMENIWSTEKRVKTSKNYVPQWTNKRM